MGLRHLPSIVETLIRHGRSGGTKSALIQEGTTAFQTVARATLAELPALSQGFRPPAIVVIGEVTDVMAVISS
jgi:uroporphyrin-III C-methyltransferase / precorrin-2 dehydrogenase / sirohydrochlorin ferrochelatase